MTTANRRLAFKLSGEGLAAADAFGNHPGVIRGLAGPIRGVPKTGVRRPCEIPCAAPFLRGSRVPSAIHGPGADVLCRWGDLPIMEVDTGVCGHMLKALCG